MGLRGIVTCVSDTDGIRPAPAAQPGSAPSGGGMRYDVFRGAEHLPAPDGPDALSALLEAPGTYVWCDAVDPTEADLAPLERLFGLHPLAVEDALHAHQRPKVEEYGGGESAYWFIVVHPVTLADDDLVLHEMAIFAGRNFVITVRDRPAYSVDDIRTRWLADSDAARSDSGFLLHALLDTVVDGYFPIAEWFEERVDAIEASLFEASSKAGSGILLRIFRMKKDSQRFRRAAWPMRDVLAPIVRADLPIFSDAHNAYFRDVYDHAVRVIDQVDATRDLANSALDVQLAVTANRQNEVSKQLTIIATVFLPLSFITGFFGQNFAVLVGHMTTARAFWVFGVASEVVAVIGLLILFKRRGWF
jgi:magnesium transporter